MDWTAPEVRALRSSLRRSIREFAGYVGATEKSVRNWEAGKHHPQPASQRQLDRAYERLTPEQRRRFDEALSSGEFPVPSLVLPSLAPDPDLYERITRAVRHPRRVDEVAFNWLERCLAEHRRAEDEIGSAPMLDVIRAQLSTVATLARNAKGPLAKRFVALASEYAQFMAWLCNDSGDKAAALAWYDRSHDWAVEAGVPDMAATTLSMKAHLAWSVGDPVRSVRLGEAARWHEGRTSAGVQGMAAQMTARGHAIGGDADAARATLDQAETLIRRAADRPEDEPPWLYFYDETWFTLQRGMVELQIGDGGRAVELLTRALDELPTHYRRDRAWYGSCLAQAHLVAGDLDAATAVAVSTAPEAVAINRYAVDELRGVADNVGERAERQGRVITETLSGDASEG